MSPLALALALLVATPVAVAPAPPPLTSSDAPEVIAIGRELRCPVCQGMPIGESPSETAQAMMKRVRELHAEGKSPDEIRAYFVARYGEWVLLQPTSEGFGLVVWVLPPVALALGLLLLARVVKKSRAAKVAAPSAPAAGGPAGPAAAAEDDYLQRVRETIERGEA